MICFDIYLNDKKLCRAGMREAVVLNSNLSWAKRLGDEDELFLQVGGLYTPDAGGNAHPRWIEQLQITAGDKITIEVINAEHADQPVGEKIYTQQSDEEQERKYFEHLKAKFEGEIL